MKISSILLLGACFVAASLNADEIPSGGFTSEKLDLGAECIYVLSEFKEAVYFTAYSYAGEPLWEVPFNSEILSWKSTDIQVFIFSKARNGQACFLTCIDAKSGTFLWEKIILAPQQQ